MTARRCALVIPVKAFSTAKVRLAPALSPAERAVLARDMATAVLAACGSLHAHVVCDDAEVRRWAVERGATVIWTPGLGLNGAVQHGLDALATDHDRIVVAHADLPLAESLDHLAAGAGVTIVPDRHDDGTNVLVLPAGSEFRVTYGPGSFGRHVAEARRLDLPVTVVRDSRLGWDVDHPADLSGLPGPAA